MNWYAVYTKPKMEDAVSGKLGQQGIEVFNPKLKLKKYLRRQYRDVIEPLFPCYVFGRFEPETHLWMITYTRGVKKVVGGKAGPWPVAEEVIDFIRCHEKDGLIIIGQAEICEGDKVTIASGPFAGLAGIFERPMRGSERVVLLLNALGYQTRVIIEKEFLIKAG